MVWVTPRNATCERCENLYTLARGLSFEFQWSILGESQTLPRRLSTTTDVSIFPRENCLFNGKFQSLAPPSRLSVPFYTKFSEDARERYAEATNVRLKRPCSSSTDTNYQGKPLFDIIIRVSF